MTTNDFWLVSGIIAASVGVVLLVRAIVANYRVRNTDIAVSGVGHPSSAGSSLAASGYWAGLIVGIAVCAAALITAHYYGLPLPERQAAKNEEAAKVQVQQDPMDPEDPEYYPGTGKVATKNRPPAGLQLAVYWEGGTDPPTDPSGGHLLGRVSSANIGKGAKNVRVQFINADGSKAGMLMPATVK